MGADMTVAVVEVPECDDLAALLAERIAALDADSLEATAEEFQAGDVGNGAC